MDKAVDPFVLEDFGCNYGTSGLCDIYMYDTRVPHRGRQHYPFLVKAFAVIMTYQGIVTYLFEPLRLP